MDSKLRKMAILASMAVILLVALLVMYVNREQFTAASGPPASGTQNAGAGDSASPAENGVQAEETVSPDGQIGNDLKAFLKDNTFFDQEVNPILEAAKDNSNRLSLVATSIEKDLRIQIVDNEGIPVTGESFYVRLDGLVITRIWIRTVSFTLEIWIPETIILSSFPLRDIRFRSVRQEFTSRIKWSIWPLTIFPC